MALETVARFRFHRQGVAIVAANATYPTSTPVGGGNNIDRAANSNSNGVWIDARRVSEKVAIRVTTTGTNTTANVAVYGYIPSYNSTANVSTSLQQWDHIINLNGGTAIGPTTDATGAVNVISNAADNYRYNEMIILGGAYERVLVIPVAVAGVDVNIAIDVGFCGES